MGIKEILAAKQAAKAAAEALTAALQSPEVNVEPAPPEVAAPTVSPLDTEEASVPTMADALDAETVGEFLAAVKTAEASRPMTFAEKLAAKKGLIAAAQAKPPAPPPKAVIDPAMIPENAEDAQAYVDIKNKIEALAVVDGDDLRGAMSQLKAALKKNAAACELMLDEDLGKMVVALRRMTHVVIEEAKSPTKKASAKAPKAKEVALTAEQIEAAFNEL